MARLTRTAPVRFQFAPRRRPSSGAAQCVSSTRQAPATLAQALTTYAQAVAAGMDPYAVEIRPAA